MPPPTHTLFSVDQTLHPETGAGLDDDGSPRTLTRFSTIGCNGSAVPGVIVRNAGAQRRNLYFQVTSMAKK